MSQVAKEIRRLRKEKDWTQTELAVYAGSSQPTINQIENGARNPSTRTLEKIAGALGIEVADLFPKAEEPLPFEEDGQRLSNVPDALEAWMLVRAAKHERELQDPDSLHFRTATAGALWAAEVREEATMWAEWVTNWATRIMPSAKSLVDIQLWLDTAKVMGYVFAFHLLADKAERRVKKMADKPDELAQKRLDRAATEAEESQRRINALMAANG